MVFWFSNLHRKVWTTFVSLFFTIIHVKIVYTEYLLPLNICSCIVFFCMRRYVICTLFIHVREPLTILFRLETMLYLRKFRLF